MFVKKCLYSFEVLHDSFLLFLQRYEGLLYACIILYFPAQVRVAALLDLPGPPVDHAFDLLVDSLIDHFCSKIFIFKAFCFISKHL